jgi:transcription initiation factor TFIIB
MTAAALHLNKTELNQLLLNFKNSKPDEVEDEDQIEIDIYDETFCPHCGNEDALVIEEGCFECRICGVKQDIKLNMEQEWRYYGDNDSKGSDPNRVGMPTNALLPESSLGSIIGSKGGDFSKLRQYHQYNIMPYKERSLWNTFTFIQNRCLMANIPGIIIEDAKCNYKMVSEQKISRGSNRKGIVANCVYFSCKKNNVPRSMKEIAEIFGINVSEMTKGKKKYEDIMYQQSKCTMTHINSTNPFDYIDRFCSNLNIDLDIKHICQFVVFEAMRQDIFDDNTPPSIAAGAIFLVATVLNMRINKVSVHIATKISEVTISKCFKKLNQYKEQLFPRAAIQKYNIVFDRIESKTYQKKKKQAVAEDKLEENNE